jgi:hypothetical protein
MNPSKQLHLEIDDGFNFLLNRVICGAEKQTIHGQQSRKNTGGFRLLPALGLACLP